MSRQKSVLTAISGMDTAIAGGHADLLRPARASRSAGGPPAFRFGRRTRLERWTRVPVPKGYAGPKRRARQASLGRGWRSGQA